ncbi:MAG: glycosyltransferase, partial [Planctomycetota bacterium]
MNDSPPISDISLIINTFQKPRHLGLVLQSIVSQEQVDGRFEVIVTDDGSTDSTAELVHSFATASPFPVRFITQPHDGFRLSQIRNRGARIARGKALLFLDGDCMLPHDHVVAHLHRLRPGVALIGNCARLTQDTSAALAVDQLAPTDLTTLAPRSEKRSLAWRYRKAWWHNLTGHPSKPRLSGSNFSVWLEDFKRVNGFDERFVGWGQEDDDFGLRLRGAGVRLESILDRTYSLHVWHPSDPSATRRWRDGPNIDY